MYGFQAREETDIQEETGSEFIQKSLVDHSAWFRRAQPLIPIQSRIIILIQRLQ